MNYMAYCSDEKIKETADIFCFPEDIKSKILFLKNMIFGKEEYIKDFLKCCYDVFDNKEFRREELQRWPYPKELGKIYGEFGLVYYYLVLFAGIGHILSGMKEVMIKRDIPENIIADTLKDMSSDLKGYEKRFGAMPPGSLGFRIYVNFGGEYFRLGRLAFHINTFSGKINVIRNRETGILTHIPEDSFFDGGQWELLLKKGDTVLDVHIPGGGPMDIDLCKRSMKEAVIFFKKHFPEKEISFFTCYSWLFDSRLELLLSPQSNIVRFQRMFHIYDTLTSNDELFGNVFGYIPEDFSKVNLDTSLKKAIAIKIEGKTLPEPGGGSSYLMFDELYLEKETFFMNENMNINSNEIRQTRFSDVCGSIDEIKRILHEEEPEKVIKPLLDDITYMIGRMNKRIDEYKDFTDRTAETLSLLKDVKDLDKGRAEEAVKFLEYSIGSPEAFTANEKEKYYDEAEVIRSLANGQEHLLRVYKDLSLKIYSLFEEIKGDRNWLLTIDKQSDLLLKLKLKYQSWLPPEPHRSELLKRLVHGEDIVKEETAGKEPMVYFNDGGAIYMSQIRYDPIIKNFHPASFRPGPTGRSFRENRE